jgi:hypothetical protein
MVATSGSTTTFSRLGFARSRNDLGSAFRWHHFHVAAGPPGFPISATTWARIVFPFVIWLTLDSSKSLVSSA